MQLSNWAPEHSDALRELLARGMSYAEIADAINEKFGTCYTRNATIGRSRRMGLGVPERPDDGLKPSPRSRTPKLSGLLTLRALRQEKLSEKPSEKPGEKPAEAEPAEPVKLRCVGLSPRLLPLTELEDGDCRYPYGGDREDEPILFCGHPRLAGSRYCSPHFHLTRDDGTSAERADAPVVLRLVEAA
jgi:GcrA cell cycle regulator